MVLTFAMLALIGAGVLGLTGGIFVSGASQSYNNVQIFVQTQATDKTYQYMMSVYNSSGGLVAYTQSQYPAFGIEIPNGTYLFAVSAVEENYGVACPIAYSAQQSSQSGPNAVMPPYRCYGYSAEYGYLLQQISDSGSYNIATKNVSDIGLNTVSVTVVYSNGTAASGVDVSASVVGSFYYWNGANNEVMWNQTGSDGVTTLTIPALPVEVTSWASVPVILPKNYTTTQVTVAGQPVNVTAYWQPMYVGFTGSALIIPPSTSAKIVLEPYQENYYPIAYAAGTATSGVATPPIGANSGIPGGIPSTGSQNGASTSQFIQNQIPPLTIVSTKMVSQPEQSLELLSIGVIAAIIVAALSMSIVVLRRK